MAPIGSTSARSFSESDPLRVVFDLTKYNKCLRPNKCRLYILRSFLKKKNYFKKKKVNQSGINRLTSKIGRNPTVNLFSAKLSICNNDCKYD